MLFDEENSTLGNVKYTQMVDEVKSTNLEMHPYTVRKDSLPEYVKDVDEMYRYLFYEAGATGLFTDFPDLAVKFLHK